MDVQRAESSFNAGGSPPSSRGLRSGLGAALIVLVAVGGVAAAMYFSRSQDARPIEQAAPTTTVAPVEPPASPTTTIPPGRLSPGYPAGEDAAARFGGWGPSGPGKPLPPLDLPTIDYAWVTATLPIDGEAWIGGVVPFQGRFIALVSGPDPVTAVWESVDGATWTRVETRGSAPAGGGVERVFAGPDRLYVTGHIWDENASAGTTSEAVVWTSADGVTWSRADLGLALRPYENLWFNAVAAGPSGAVLFGTRDYYPPSPPVRIEKDGKVLVLNGEDYTYEIRDGAGNVLASGSQEEMWNNGEDGQVVSDPATGEILVVIPWDVWNAAYEQAYRYDGLGIGDKIPSPGAIEVEYDGVRLTIDERVSYTYRAEDAASGALLAEGSLDDLYRGPRPRFTDSSGAVIFTISWQELDKANEDSSRDTEYSSTPIILTTRDGTTWQSVPIDRAVWGEGQLGINALVAGPAGFLAVGSIWPDSGPGVLESEPGLEQPYVEPEPVPVQVWSSQDGQTWEKAGTFPAASWVGEVVATESGYAAIGGDDAGVTALWTSTDGRTWTQTIDPLSLGVDENLWFEHVLVGNGGLYLTGTRSGPAVAPSDAPAVVGRDGRTLTMGTDGSYTVTEDATGAVLFEETPVYHEGDEPAPQTGIIYASDGLVLADTSGTVVFRVTNAELEEAWAAVQPEWYEPETFFLFSSDLATWEQVSRPAGEAVPTWYAGLTTGNGALVAYGSLDQAVEMSAEGAVDPAVPSTPPLQVLLVGRPS